MDFAHKIEWPGILMLLGITQETRGYYAQNYALLELLCSY